MPGMKCLFTNKHGKVVLDTKNTKFNGLCVYLRFFCLLMQVCSSNVMTTSLM